MAVEFAVRWSHDRPTFPKDTVFTIELRLSTVKRYRVTVTLDLEERYLFRPSGVLPDVSDSIEESVSQLSTITLRELQSNRFQLTRNAEAGWQQ